MKLHPLPAFSDNYIWVVHDEQRALVVDPGDAAPVQHYLRAHGLTLAAILVTHHHPDHVGGLSALIAGTDIRVFGPAKEKLPVSVQPVQDGDTIDALGLSIQVLDVPGHTAGHVAYLLPPLAANAAPVLFCGDTLFSGGCGRLFEGTPAQMLASMDRLSALPEATQVCAAHEYTLSNLTFARHVEPENADLIRYEAACKDRRAQGLPTLPSTIGQELRINPFMRVREPAIARRVTDHAKLRHTTPEPVFAALREWKNHF